MGLLSFIKKSLPKALHSFFPLLEEEKAAANAAVQLRLQTWPAERLEDEGYCIRDLKSFWQDATVLGKPVASFFLDLGEELPRHLFRYITFKDRR